ncbi:FAD-dependent oxidoreductase [Arachidicoccus terrestris]|uniref:FAD-dependent oxidoreductase n=1 Tax=Arachidicoccus terrestris TaxID=2875539 RepID=UPI001CC70D42|nr:NAD(P)/FAD-dependent oxidoreductase [Arachidicoccus terrestris]UAY54628.1 FAD-dependent monooxygenase [Arachidicoccus terrestris]
MLLRNTKVAIIGAGPVGLTMAKLLQQGGATAIVYERDVNAAARIWGGTLDLHKKTGQRALKKAGLLDQYFALSTAMGIKFADQRGTILVTKTPTAESQYDNPEINRNALRTMLLQSLLPGTIHWNKRLTTLETSDRKWILGFLDHTQAAVDVVILADGGLSKMRHFVTETSVEETGSFIVQGDVSNPEINCPELYRLCDEHRLMVAYGGYLLVINPLNNGTMTYGLVFKKPAEWSGHHPLDFNNRLAVIEYFSEQLDGWSDLYKGLFKVTEKFVVLPTRKLPLHNTWKSNRPLPITCIGDAAHLMPPFAGMGVNIGLLDAMILSENLTERNFASINDAIFDYEQQMFVYASAASKQSSENEMKMHDAGFQFQTLME